MTIAAPAPPSPLVRQESWPGRVLHLVDSRDHVAGLAGPVREVLATRPDDRVVSIGDSIGSGELARLMPAGRRVMGPRGRGLARLLRETAGSGITFDIVHAWGIRPTAMVGSIPGGQGAVSTLDTFVTDDPVALDAAIVVRSGRVESLFGSRRAQAAAFGLGGSALSRSGRERVACPGVHPDRLADRREELREQWGAGDRSMVLGVIGDPMDLVNLRDLAGLSVWCSHLGYDTVVVASSRVQRRGEVARWLGGMKTNVRLVLDDVVERTAEVVRGLDVAVAPSAIGSRTRICGVSPVMTAVAAGLPVVLSDEHPAAEFAVHEDLLSPGSTHDEHGATKWALARLKAGPGEARERSLRRVDRYLAAVNECYARAVSGVGTS